jgi:hypothetical protein
MASLTCNGITLTPTEVDEDPEKVGVEHRALSGKRSQVVYAIKEGWVLRFVDVDTATKNQVRAIWRTMSTMTFVSEEGTSYTVLVPFKAYKAKRGLSGDPNAPFWTVELRVVEA